MDVWETAAAFWTVAVVATLPSLAAVEELLPAAPQAAVNRVAAIGNARFQIFTSSTPLKPEFSAPQKLW
jgi:hypothetical protein